MANFRFQVSKPVQVPQTLEATIAHIEQLTDEINLAFRDLEDIQRKVLSAEEATATLNLQSTRLTNLSASVDANDAVTRKEIEDLGLPIGRPTRAWVPSGAIDATRPIRVPQALSRSDAVPLWQVSAVTENTLAAGDLGMPSVRDGAEIDIEDRAGTNGSTKGTLIYAAREDDELKARVLRQTPRGLSIDTGQLEQLLFLILEKLDDISRKLGD